MSKKQCTDCGPLPVNHLDSWVGNLVDFLINKIEYRLRAWKIWIIFYKIGNFLGPFFVWFFAKPRIIVFESNFNREKVYNRTLVLLDEAKKLGIEAGVVTIFGRYNNQFFFKKNNQRIIFEGLPLKHSLKPENLLIDDKAEIKKILAENNLPVAEGQGFWRYSSGLKYGLKLGFPLVVKPRWGSISRHVFINVKNREDLARAIKSAKKTSPFFIVERYLAEVTVFRATLVNFKLAAVAKRIPANIVGDGEHSIKDLVEEKNADSRRGQPGQKDATYLKIVIDKTTDKLLSQKGLTLNSIPAKGERIYLQEKIILDLGADLIDVTDKVYPDNIAVFEKAARIFDASIVGIDFLCVDISRPWQGQNCAIIELNSLPFIDMHHFPLEGQPRNVAAAVWGRS